MEEEWYYMHGERQLGPISPADLKLLAGGGSISRDTMVWTAGLEDWVPASRIENLFAEPEPPRPRLLTGAIAQTAAAVRPQVASAIPTAGVAGSQTPFAPGPHSQPFSPGQTAPPGTEFPAPGPMKANFTWFVVLPVLTILTPLSFFFLVSFGGKDTSDLVFLLAMTGGIVFVFFAIVVLMAVFFGVFKLLKMLALHRAWRAIAAGGIRTPPGTAVGFLFIPLFGFYWMFVAYLGLARDWNRIRASHPNLAGAPRLSEASAMMHCVTYGLAGIVGLVTMLVEPEGAGAFIGVVFLVLVLVAVICELIYIHGMCRVVNYMGQLHYHGTRPAGVRRLY